MVINKLDIILVLILYNNLLTLGASQNFSVRVPFNENDKSVLTNIKMNFNGTIIQSLFDVDNSCPLINPNGVSCDLEGHVTNIGPSEPTSSYDNPYLPPYLNSSLLWEDLLKLKHLKIIDLTNLNLSGVGIPESINELKNLTKLDLSGNKLKGEIPPLDGLQNLNELTLNENQFSGSISNAMLPSLAYLDLSLNNFSESIPDSIGAMTNLVKLWLSSNALSGELPNGFSNLVNLNDLNLAANNLRGEFPFMIYFQKSIIVSIRDNYFTGPSPNIPAQLRDNNCFDDQNPRSDRCLKGIVGLGKKTVAISITIPIFFFLLLLSLVSYVLMKRRKRLMERKKVFGDNYKNTVKSFSLREIKSSTRNFEQELGKGGYGSVYKAVLGGKEVAIKRLDKFSKQGDVEFIREVDLLSRVHHRHLVELIGFCAESGERMLVYEYMAMGNLYDHIHGDSAKQYPLSWDSRIKIAIHVALGLEYLHYGADPPLIHRDIKSANILLSEDGYSKLADFGLCKESPLCGDGSETVEPTATAVRGSFGYLDPQYVKTSILSEKSDVYSYGVVLLELITGFKSIHEYQPLAMWCRGYLLDPDRTTMIADKSLVGNFDLDEFLFMCDVARQCTEEESSHRPTIREVAKSLVENLSTNLMMSNGSVNDSSSILESSMGDMSSHGFSISMAAMDANSMDYHNYSETLHWIPPKKTKPSEEV